MSVLGNDHFLIPGMSSVRQSNETQIQWNAGRFMVFSSGDVVDGAARDSGATPTTALRGGLPLGKKTSTGKLLQWDPTATDGTEVLYGFLPFDVRVTDLDANNLDRHLATVIGGYVRSAGVVATANNLKLLKAQGKNRFWFDDEIPPHGPIQYPIMREVAKTADYTVVAADNGTTFTNTGAAGAVVFTLPALAPGLAFEFRVVADQNVTVASVAGDDMIVFNDAAADSVAFSTAGQKIGGGVLVFSNAAGTKWYVRNASAGANTITVAT